MSNQDEQTRGQTGRAVSYLDYIKNRRSKLSDTVSGAMIKLGILGEPAQSEKQVDTASGDSLKNAMKLQRQTLNRQAQVVTIYGKIAAPVNQGGLAARIQRELKQPQSVQETARGVTIAYPDGSTRELGFAAAGSASIVLMKDRDQSVWKLEACNTWSQFVGGLPTGKGWKGVLSVNSNGDCIFQNEDDGETITERVDGSKSVRDPSGGGVEFDPKGCITAILNEGRTIRRFQYSDNRLSTIEEPDGSSLHREGEHWIVVDASGNRTEETRNGEFSIDELGVLTFVDAQSGAKKTESPSGVIVHELGEGYITTQYPDGTRFVLCPDGTGMRILSDGTIITESETGTLTQQPDGVFIETAPGGLVLRVQSARNTSRDFYYDSADRLYEISDFDNTVWHRYPGDVWNQCAQAGQESGLRFSGKLHVEQTGQLVIQLSAEVSLVHNANGTAALIQPDGKTARNDVHSLSCLAPWFEQLKLESSPLMEAPANSHEADQLNAVKPQTEEHCWYRASTADLSVVVSRDELDRICRIQHPDGAYRNLVYAGSDNEVCALTDHTACSAIRNSDDGTWTMLSSAGDVMGTTESAVVRVTEDGCVIWHYLSSGAETISRPDGSAIQINANGEIQQYLSPAGNRFVHAMTYKIFHKDTIDSIARELLFLLQPCTGAPLDVDSVASCIAELNNLDIDAPLPPGMNLLVPGPL